MSKKDVALAPIMLALIFIGLLLWIFYEIAKAGIRGKDATLHRCGNCNWVLRPQQSPCPNCGYTVRWN